MARRKDEEQAAMPEAQGRQAQTEQEQSVEQPESRGGQFAKIGRAHV